LRNRVEIVDVFQRGDKDQGTIADIVLDVSHQSFEGFFVVEQFFSVLNHSRLKDGVAFGQKRAVEQHKVRLVVLNKGKHIF
jgi:hypothetical protein